MPAEGRFTFEPETEIRIPEGDEALRTAARRFAEPLRRATALALPVRVGTEGTPGVVLLTIDATAMESERYRLDVGPEGIHVTAGSPAGLGHALQTLRQLLPPEVEQAWPVSGRTGFELAGAPAEVEWSVPAVFIEDAPRFSYRGMHLDVGRHFFPVAFIKRYLDLLAAYKLNTFHWHLTEDQGWRIEIKRYPRLTEVGAFREETVVEKNFDPYIGDGTPYGGFYTQDEIREVVAYAQERGITVIPEIEMPGHSLAALAAYPELACTQGPFEVATRWGIFEDIYCPKEETFRFLEDVLTEVMELFPGTYIHIGGDEAPKRRWIDSPIAREVMQREGLETPEELQSYFIKRIETFLVANGRRLIGWDEILEGGLAPEATVMSWRGTVGGIEAAVEGHDVIMTPFSHLYFDYYQGDPAQEPFAIGGFIPLERVYSFEPVPPELSAEQARHILGAQGNVWTEYMKTPEHVEYMAVPRMLALAEVVWSGAEDRDYADFMRRLGRQLRRLDRLDVNYRVPDVLGLERDRGTLGDQIELELRSPVEGGVVHYTLDDSDPDGSSPVADRVVEVSVDETPTSVAARLILPGGRSSAVRRASLTKLTLVAPASVDEDALESGLDHDYYEGSFESTSDLRAAAVRWTRVSERPEIPADARPESFGLRFTGYLRVERDAVYRFELESDDGSVLRVGNRTVVDHDGPHTLSAREGLAALEAGYHEFELSYFQATGGGELEVRWGPETGELSPLAADDFFRNRRPRQP